MNRSRVAVVAFCAGALTLVVGPALAKPDVAVAATRAPDCPAKAAGYRFSDRNLVEGKNQYTLQCSYTMQVGDGVEGLSITVTWKLREGDSVFVGARPCSGSTTSERSAGGLSVASGTHAVGSQASASFSSNDGIVKSVPVPPDVEPVVAALVAKAESLAIACDADETTSPSAATGQADNTDAAPTDSQATGSPTDGEILLAAGLIMLLLAGLGPQILRTILQLLPTRGGEVEGALVEAGGGAAGAGHPDVPSQPPETPGAVTETLEPMPPARVPPAATAEPPPVPPATAGQISALENEFADTVQKHLDEGYWVRNPDLVSKVWNTFANPFWGSRSGQCGEFAANGVRWMRDHVQDQFGPGAIVDEVYIVRRSVLVPNPDLLDQLDAHIPVNHAATRVILPDGRRYVMDFWDAMGPSQGEPAKMVPEKDWVARWTQRVPSGQISRSETEKQLYENVTTMGDDKGLRAYRFENEKSHQSVTAETLINSWRVEPW